MELQFFKYQGTGNDFILLDNRQGLIDLTPEQRARLCNRRFGIGADGLMLLETVAGYDFHMAYYNADGHESSMCGNGGRCIAAFARRLGVCGSTTSFTAIDGPHQAWLQDDGQVSLQMQDVQGITQQDGCSILNTGSPHYVAWVEDVAQTDVFAEGRRIRNLERFGPKGINVNFAGRSGDALYVRTYERGVEDETLSCGTGVTACAIAATGTETGSFQTQVHTPGGLLEVRFVKTGPGSATDVVLSGPATFVFEGRITV